MNPTITKISDMGKLIELSDGSKWEVDPVQATRSSIWIPGDQIATVGSGYALYPTIPVNITKVECVTAKREGT